MRPCEIHLALGPVALRYRFRKSGHQLQRRSSNSRGEGLLWISDGHGFLAFFHMTLQRSGLSFLFSGCSCLCGGFTHQSPVVAELFEMSSPKC